MSTTARAFSTTAPAWARLERHIEFMLGKQLGEKPPPTCVRFRPPPGFPLPGGLDSCAQTLDVFAINLCWHVLGFTVLFAEPPYFWSTELP